MRPQKEGLDYFPMDVDLRHDSKFRCIKHECGWECGAVILYLLNDIFREGYFMEWTEVTKRVFCDDTGVPLDYVERLIDSALRWKFFSPLMLESHQILTSRGIQKRFLLATMRRKTVCVDPRFDLVSLPEQTKTADSFVNTETPTERGYCTQKPPLSGVTVRNNPHSTLVSAYKSTQRKEKKRKEKKTNKQPTDRSTLKDENVDLKSHEIPERKEDKEVAFVFVPDEKNIKNQDSLKYEIREGIWLTKDEEESLKEEFQTGELDYWLNQVAAKPTEVKSTYRSVSAVIRSWRLRKLEDGKAWCSNSGHYLPAGSQNGSKGVIQNRRVPLFKPEPSKPGRGKIDEKTRKLLQSLRIGNQESKTQETAGEK